MTKRIRDLSFTITAFFLRLFRIKGEDGKPRGKFIEKLKTLRFSRLSKRHRDEPTSDFKSESARPTISIELAHDGHFILDYRSGDIDAKDYTTLFKLLTEECIGTLIFMLKEQNPKAAQIMLAKYQYYNKQKLKSLNKPVVSPLNVLATRSYGN